MRGAITKSGMMATLGGECPTGVSERIGMIIQAGDTDLVEAGGLGAVNGMAGIALIRSTTPVTATAA